MIVPDAVVRHVDQAKSGEARIAVVRLSGTIENPTLCFILNGMGAVGLTSIVKHAIQTAPNPDDRKAWAGLGQQITAAILGAMGPTS